MRCSVWLAITLLILIATAPASDSARPCTAPEYHQFDFETGTRDAHVRVDSILDGCVLHEQYEGADGHRGESFSIYDASRKLWHQTWVTNRGELLMIEGTLQNGSMVLAGANLDSAGHEKRVRGEWKPINGGVRETAVTSADGGKTWKPWFDLLFRPTSSTEHKNSD